MMSSRKDPTPGELILSALITAGLPAEVRTRVHTVHISGPKATVYWVANDDGKQVTHNGHLLSGTLELSLS